MGHLAQKRSIDVFDVVCGLIPWLAGFATFVVWARLIVGAIRGEEEAQNWRIDTVTAAFIGAGALVSAARARSNVALHGSVTETRELLKEAASDAEGRDERDAARQDQLYRVTVKMAWVAGLTLAAAIVTLIVTIVRASTFHWVTRRGAAGRLFLTRPTR